MNTIAVLHKVKKQKLALITRSILHGNSITQKSHLIYWLKNKNFKYFVVENIRPETKENHLQNIYRLEKDVISLMKRCNKREYLKDECLKITEGFYDYIKIFDLQWNTDKITIESVTLKLTKGGNI